MMHSTFAAAALALILAPQVALAAVGEYSYESDAELGPANWANVDLEDNQCGGDAQSPIAIESFDCTEYSDYKLVDGDCPLSSLTYTIANNGVVVAYPTDGSCALNTVEIPGMEGTYEAIQFHIHSSSEHTVDGMFYGAELHIVHALRDTNETRYAVVGILLNPGLEVDNPEFEMVLDGWKKARQENYATCGLTERLRKTRGRRNLQTDVGPPVTDPNAHVNAYDLLSTGATFYQYRGSLTTPPCSEVVDWNFSPENNLISVQQYKELIELEYTALNPETCEVFTIVNAYGSTSRPTQPINGREIRHICPNSYQVVKPGYGNMGGGGGGKKASKGSDDNGDSYGKKASKGSDEEDEEEESSGKKGSKGTSKGSKGSDEEGSSGKKDKESGKGQKMEKMKESSGKGKGKGDATEDDDERRL